MPFAPPVAVTAFIWQKLEAVGIPVTQDPTLTAKLALVPEWVRHMFVYVRIEGDRRRRKDSSEIAAKFCSIAFANPDIRNAFEALFRIEQDETDGKLAWNYVKSTLAIYAKKK